MELLIYLKALIVTLSIVDGSVDSILPSFEILFYPGLQV